MTDMSPVNWALHAARGWDRIEIVRDGARFGVVGVSTCGRRWEAATVPSMAEARSRGRDTADFLGAPLIDATTRNTRQASDSGMRSFRWGG